jgi:hypothetical protein
VEEKKVQVFDPKEDLIQMEGGMCKFLMSLKETMKYARKYQVLPKNQVILGIVSLESKSYLTWKPTGCQEDAKEKSP